MNDALLVIWESLDFVCAERLTPALVATARLLAAQGELALTPALEAQLGQISRASVQRRLTRFVQLGQPGPDVPRLPRGGPNRANRVNAVARQIPMQRIAWDEPEPGHCEVDLVQHGGSEPLGEYAYTLQLVDVATGWSERVALLGRSQRAMADAFRQVQARIPFRLRELHPDNGSEFLNDHLVRLWGELVPGLKLSRSRPYKNDNRFVEQKNDTLVRAYLGHDRLDTPEQVAALNALYDDMWVYYNFFQPVLHLTEKTVVDGRLRRRWDAATPPLDRLCATGVLAADAQAALLARRATVNPRALRRHLYAALDRLRGVATAPGTTPADGETPRLGPSSAAPTRCSPPNVACPTPHPNVTSGARPPAGPVERKRRAAGCVCTTERY